VHLACIISFNPFNFLSRMLLESSFTNEVIEAWRSELQKVQLSDRQGRNQSAQCQRSDLMSPCWAASLEYSGVVQRQGLHVAGNTYIWYFAIIKNLSCVAQVLLGKVKDLFLGFVGFIRLRGIWDSGPQEGEAGWLGHGNRFYMGEHTHAHTWSLGICSSWKAFLLHLPL